MSCKVAKAALRKEMKDKLAILTDEEISLQSKAVLQKLFSNDVFKTSQRISVYLSMKHEIATTNILQYIFEHGKQCFIPKYTVGGSTMDMVSLISMEDYDNLPTTKWNIKQPAADDIRVDALDTGGLDVIVAPGMAFTKQGDRLGHGRGYYDSYLARCMARPGSKKPFYVGLAFKEQILGKIPTDSSDVPLDLVLSA